MADHLIGELPFGVKLRILLILYKSKNFVRPALRVIGFTPRMSWSEVEFAVMKMQPSLARFSPEFIIGIGVGGTIFAAMLAGNIGGDIPFISIDRKVSWDDNERAVQLVGANGLTAYAEHIVGKRILLVSGEIESGQTVRALKSQLSMLTPKSIKNCCLNYSRNAQPIPDFYYINSDFIIQKPWRFSKTYSCPDDNTRPA